MIFSHIIVGARDLERLSAFYDQVLSPLGLARGTADDDGGPPGAVWHVPGRQWPQFWIQHPFNRLPATWATARR